MDHKQMLARQGLSQDSILKCEAMGVNLPALVQLMQKLLLQAPQIIALVEELIALFPAKPTA